MKKTAEYNGLTSKLWSVVRHYNHEKYWNMRDYVCMSEKRSLKALYYLFRIKKMDAYHNASMGTHMSFDSAIFKEHPNLPHGLNGIIVSNSAVIGTGCTIFHVNFR